MTKASEKAETADAGRDTTGARDTGDRSTTDRTADPSNARDTDGSPFPTDKAGADAKESRPRETVLPPNDGIPRSPSVSVAMPRVGRVAGKVATGEPDHSGVAQAREEQEARVKSDKDARMKRREKIRAGNIWGHFVPFGNSLVNMNSVVILDLPTEGDENPTVAVTLMSGRVVSVSGDEATDIMEELGLYPLPKPEDADRADPRNMVHREDGRILTLADHKASEDGARIATVPNHPHRANAILQDAETDKDVQNRAGGAAIPPTRDFNVPVGETDATEPKVAGEAKAADGEAEGEGDAGSEAGTRTEGADESDESDARTGTRETRSAESRTAKPRATEVRSPRGGRKGK